MEDIAASERLLRDEYGYTRVEVLNTRAMRERVNSSYYIGGMYSPDSAHLHPLNYTLGLAAAAEKTGAEIYENTEAISVSKGKPIEIYTAGNAYLKGIFPQLRSRIMPVGTYMIATAPLGRDLAADTIRDSSCVADMNFVLDYYRLSQDDRMLYGGRVSYSTLEPLSIKASIGRRMEFVFPQLKNVPLEYAWGGFVAITVNRFPHFGRTA
ncbi:hypothetical protein CHS0354_018491 [Potamilus streckersoni]|uniref:FAD dependent oxidoreductase domain-containing protein n=1 Tax=Potamilus streckersoni TaxID=2493646 RepID=A0AAE0TB06_9BIVA|nr:hypothetical protein CHS0354_018491 [Potamilus streckersoni]